jgi:hypothetical protein
MASLATDMEQLSVQENEEMHLQKISKKSGQVPFDAENWWLKKLPEIKAQVVIDCADKDWDADKKDYTNAALIKKDDQLYLWMINVDMPDFYGNNFDDALNQLFTKYYNESPMDYVKFDVKLGAPIPCAITGEKILDHEVCLHATFSNKTSNRYHWVKMFAQAVRSNPQFQCYFHIDRVTIPYEEIFTGYHKKKDIASMKQKIEELRAKGLEMKAALPNESFEKFQALNLKPKDAIKIHWDNTTADVTKQKIYDAKITKVYTPTKTLGYRVGVNYANRGGKEIIPVGDFMKRLSNLDIHGETLGFLISYVGLEQEEPKTNEIKKDLYESEEKAKEACQKLAIQVKKSRDDYEETDSIEVKKVCVYWTEQPHWAPEKAKHGYEFYYGDN